LRAVSPSRPTYWRAPSGAAVKTGHRPPPEAARSGLDGCEHGGNIVYGREPFPYISRAMVLSAVNVDYAFRRARNMITAAIQSEAVTIHSPVRILIHRLLTCPGSAA